MSAPVFPDNFNMADYFVFSNIEAGRGEKPAILFEGQTIPYRTVADNVMRVAKKLVSDGLLPEQRVLLCTKPAGVREGAEDHAPLRPQPRPGQRDCRGAQCGRLQKFRCVVERRS